MFRKLLISSVSAVLRQPIDSGIQVCPPPERRQAGCVRNGLQAWINSTPPPRAPAAAAERHDTHDADGANDTLAAARRDFIDTLADIRTQQAGDLLRRIRLARSLRELWFLRTEVFNLVAHHRDQAEANHRMGMLGTHFPRQVARPVGNRLGARA
jgi:hypothetical protein